MRDEGVEAFEVEQRLEVAAAGGVAVEHGGEVGAEDRAELLVAGEHRLERLIDEDGIDVGMVEPLGEAVADRVLETVMAQDGRDR